MALFKSKSAEPEPEPVVGPPEPASASAPQKKDAPTPTRREAEAARRERLNPTLSPREAKRREREASRTRRQREWDTIESSPTRQLLRDHVDARVNPGEFVLPVLLLLMALTLLPGMAAYVDWALYLSWAYIGLLIVDAYLMWRSFKKLAAQRYPGASLKGLVMYGINRQISLRRWRQPAPRVKRGEKY